MFSRLLLAVSMIVLGATHTAYANRGGSSSSPRARSSSPTVNKRSTLGRQTNTTLRQRLARRTRDVHGNDRSIINNLTSRNGFNVQRNLSHYRTELGQEFHAKLQSLGADAHWIDVGAGRASAIRDFVRARTNKGTRTPRITAIGVVKPKNAFASRRYRYLAGRTLDQYSVDEIGQADLITDVYGAAVYAGTFDQTVEQYGLLLREGGEVWIQANDHVTINGEDLNDSSATRAVLEQWIARSTGMELIGIASSGAIGLRRTAGSVRMAPLHLQNVNVDTNYGSAASDEPRVYGYQYNYVMHEQGAR